MIGLDDYTFERGRSLGAMHAKFNETALDLMFVVLWCFIVRFQIQTKFKHAFLHSIIIFSSFI